MISEQNRRRKWQDWLVSPAVVTLLVSVAVIAVALVADGGDALNLVRIGTFFSEGDPSGSKGYDGQFIYYIMINPDPEQVAPLLDAPAYRYQRILLPLLGRLFSFGNPAAGAWVLLILGVTASTLGAWALSELMQDWGVNRWYALTYGLFSGFLLALIVDLPEPLAYGLVACGVLALERRRVLLGFILLALAVFAKEVTLVFVGAFGLSYLLRRCWREALGLGLVAVLPYLLFQAWLFSVFGEVGIGSGGAMATSFEIIPFMGLLRIGQVSIVYLLAMLLVFGPTALLPSIWGVVQSVRTWLSGDAGLYVLALFANALVIFATPYSTFRETGGMVRFLCGLVLAVLLYAGRYHHKRALNYSIFWIVLNVILIKSLGA
jgi:hypothetical protein